MKEAAGKRWFAHNAPSRERAGYKCLPFLQTRKSLHQQEAGPAQGDGKRQAYDIKQ